MAAFPITNTGGYYFLSDQFVDLRIPRHFMMPDWMLLRHAYTAYHQMMAYISGFESLCRSGQLVAAWSKKKSFGMHKWNYFILLFISRSFISPQNIKDSRSLYVHGYNRTLRWNARPSHWASNPSVLKKRQSSSNASTFSHPTAKREVDCNRINYSKSHWNLANVPKQN